MLHVCMGNTTQMKRTEVLTLSTLCKSGVKHYIHKHIHTHTHSLSLSAVHKCTGYMYCYFESPPYGNKN